MLPAAATGFERDSTAHAEQIRSVAVERVGARLGAVPSALMFELEDAVRLHVGM